DTALLLRLQTCGHVTSCLDSIRLCRCEIQYPGDGEGNHRSRAQEAADVAECDERTRITNRLWSAPVGTPLPDTPADQGHVACRRSSGLERRARGKTTRRVGTGPPGNDHQREQRGGAEREKQGI